MSSSNVYVSPGRRQQRHASFFSRIHPFNNQRNFSIGTIIGGALFMLLLLFLEAYEVCQLEHLTTGHNDTAQSPSRENVVTGRPPPPQRTPSTRSLSFSSKGNTTTNVTGPTTTVGTTTSSPQPRQAKIQVERSPVDDVHLRSRFTNP